MKENLDFAQVYEEFYTKIHVYVKRIVGKNDAEDVTQVVFDKISRNLDRFQGQSKVSTWVYRIATNTALDKLKSSSHKRSPAGPLAPLPVEIIETGEITDFKTNIKPQSPDQKLIRNEMSKCIREFVDRLSPDYRTIIILNELEGFTNKEIAEILQISIDAVKIRLHRARIQLKKRLETGCDFYLDEQSELACDRKQPVDKD